MTLLRRVRGLIGSAVIWAVGWMVVTLPLSLWQLSGVNLPWPLWWSMLGRMTYLWGMSGAAAGAVFALMMMLAERRRSLQGLSALRVAIWGGLGALALPLTVSIASHGFAGLVGRYPLTTLTLYGVTIVAGAVSAVGALKIARAPHRNLLATDSANGYLPPAI